MTVVTRKTKRSQNKRETKLFILLISLNQYLKSMQSLLQICSACLCHEWLFKLQLIPWQCSALCYFTLLNQRPRPRAHFLNNTPMYKSRSKHAYSRHRFIVIFTITWGTCVPMHIKIYCELVRSQSFKNGTSRFECLQCIQLCRRRAVLRLQFY